MPSATLTNKVACMAGGSSGINLGVAVGYAEAGAKIALFSKSPDPIEPAATGLREAGHGAFGIAAHVRDFDAVDAALWETRDRYGPIDSLTQPAQR